MFVALLVSIPVLGAVGVYLMSEARLRTYNEPPAFATPIPSDSTGLELGRHLVRTRGCFGCHGQDLEGRVFDEEWPWVARAVAPNLVRVARVSSDQELVNAIREGVGRDGRAFWSMPSYNFKHLSDSDLAAMIGFLRSADLAEETLPAPKLGWSARWRMVVERERNMAEWVALVPDLLLGPGDDPRVVSGEILAMTTCNECHGLDLRGSWEEVDISPPDLAVVAGYRWNDFVALMKTGMPPDGRNLGLMGVVARDRFAHLTEQELSDLYAFLLTLPGVPVPTPVPWRP